MVDFVVVNFCCLLFYVATPMVAAMPAVATPAIAAMAAVAIPVTGAPMSAAVGPLFGMTDVSAIRAAEVLTAMVANLVAGAPTAAVAIPAVGLWIAAVANLLAASMTMAA